MVFISVTVGFRAVLLDLLHQARGRSTRHPLIQHTALLQLAERAVLARGWHAACKWHGFVNTTTSDVRNGIPYRRLGRTGEMVSLIGVGGYHLGRQADEQETIRIVRTAVDNGINFLDNCWDYNGGASEIRMGKALRDGYRDKAFLMTKIDGRNKESAARQIDESLRRLQTDRVDTTRSFEADIIEELPLGVNRNFQSLLDLAPGTTPSAQ